MERRQSCREAGSSLALGCAGAGPAGHNRALAAAQGASASPVRVANIHLRQVRNPHQILRVTSPLFNGKCFGMSIEKKMDGGGGKTSRPGLSFHLRMSEYSDWSSSHSLLPEVPWAPWPAALPRAWACGWLLLPRSPLAPRPVSRLLGSERW